MRRIAAGFTLLELVMALAIAGSLLGVGLPAMSELVREYRASAAASELSTSLAIARIASISRGRGVTMCPSEDGWRCSDGTDWSRGWLVFTGSATDRQPPSEANVLYRHDRLAESLTAAATSGRTRVHFQATGWASGTNVTLSICSRGQRLAKVVMNNAGRTRVVRVAEPCSST